jgi:hypothetical protein
MDATTPAKGSRYNFQLDHELSYGLKIMQRDAASKKVISVRCQFCVYFGKDEVAGQKRARKQTSRIKTWESFRRELYESHHKGQHAEQWVQYQSLSAEEKKHFFEGVTPFASTLQSYCGRSDEPLHFTFNRSVVEILIGDIFFDPESQGGVTHRKALSLFEPQTESNGAVIHYSVSIKNPMQFRLSIQYLAHGLSFRQISAVLESTKAITGVGKIGSISDAQVSNYARILVAINLNIIRDVLESTEVLAYSLAFDSSTHRAVSYFALRVRLHSKGALHNIHLMAAPMFERHTAVNIFKLTVKILNALCPSWRMKVIGIASDGANVMTGRIGGVVTLLEKEIQFPVHRTWCLLHQVDLVAKAHLNGLFDGEFMSSVNKIACSLRKQETLIREMGGVKCPKLTTRWLAMGSWTKWQLQHSESLIAFFSTRLPSQVVPPEWYWPVVAAICGVFENIDITIKTLQGRTLMMSQQQTELERLIVSLIAMTEVQGPFTEEQIGQIEDASIITVGSYSISVDSVTGFLQDQGLWVHDNLEALSSSVALRLRKEIGRFIVGFVDKVAKICALRDSANLPIEETIPSVLPSYLGKLRGRDFGPLISRYRDRFSESLKQISFEQLELFKAYTNEPVLKRLLDECDGSTSFEAGWNVVQGRFPKLLRFAGALATIFPNTASVESDFSVLGWEKDEHRESLTDLSLEGVMQAKQYEMVKKL